MLNKVRMFLRRWPFIVPLSWLAVCGIIALIGIGHGHLKEGRSYFGALDAGFQDLFTRPEEDLDWQFARKHHTARFNLAATLQQANDPVADPPLARTEGDVERSLTFMFSVDGLNETASGGDGEETSRPSVLTPERLQIMCEVEKVVVKHPLYRGVCQRDAETNECLPQEGSVVNLFYADAAKIIQGNFSHDWSCPLLEAKSIQSRLFLGLRLRPKDLEFFLGTDFNESSYSTNRTRSFIQLGMPQEDHSKEVAFWSALGDDLHKYLSVQRDRSNPFSGVSPYAVSGEDGWEAGEGMRIHIWSKPMWQIERDFLMSNGGPARATILSALALILAAAYTRSLIIGFTCAVMALLSFGVSRFLLILVCQVTYFGAPCRASFLFSLTLALATLLITARPTHQKPPFRRLLPLIGMCFSGSIGIATSQQFPFQAIGVFGMLVLAFTMASFWLILPHIFLCVEQYERPVSSKVAERCARLWRRSSVEQGDMDGTKAEEPPSSSSEEREPVVGFGQIPPIVEEAPGEEDEAAAGAGGSGGGGDSNRNSNAEQADSPKEPSDPSTDSPPSSPSDLPSKIQKMQSDPGSRSSSSASTALTFGRKATIREQDSRTIVMSTAGDSPCAGERGLWGRVSRWLKGRGGKALSGGAIVAGLVVVGLSLGLVKWRVTDGSVSEQLFADNHMFSESFEHFAGWFKGNAGPTYLPVELYWRLPTHTASGSEDKAVKRDWEAVCADFPPTDLPTTLRQMEEVCKTIEEPLKCHDDLLPSCTHPIVAENQSFVVPDTLICPHRSLPGFDPDDVTWADNVTTAELLELKETMPNSVITINGEPTFLAVRFYTTVLRFATYPEMVPLAKYLERWEGELRDQGQQVAVTGGEALEYVNYETLKYFPWEIIFMFLIGMCILLVLLTLTLQNYMLGPMALFSMACAMVVMQGIASMACYGRIGAYEGVNLALSVTHLCVPTLLLAIFYAVASWEGISDRVGRVKAALRGGAPAAAVYSVYVVMAGSLFSVTESVPLMKFGLLALIAAATGLVMAFLIFLPLCVLVGPRGQEYDVRPCWPSSNIKPLTTECESTLP